MKAVQDTKEAQRMSVKAIENFTVCTRKWEEYTPEKGMEEERKRCE